MPVKPKAGGTGDVLAPRLEGSIKEATLHSLFQLQFCAEKECSQRGSLRKKRADLDYDSKLLYIILRKSRQALKKLVTSHA